MKHIGGNRIVVKKIQTGTVSDQFSVGAGASLVLVYAIDSRSEVEVTSDVTLSGQGASAIILGLVTGGGKGVCRIHTMQHHKAPGTTSTLLVKSALYDHAACHYDGSIVVSKAAQKTDAYQRNENLLLGSDAKATSSPILEIQANDVRCTHGAVVKTLDPSEMWYLASRGIAADRARGMIVSGFLESALTIIEDATQRENVLKQLNG